MFCPTSFFRNQIQIDQFEKKLVGQNMNNPPPPRINVLATALFMTVYIIANWIPYANHMLDTVRLLHKQNYVRIIYDLPQRKYRYYCENQSD